jgi:iron complex outermembrane receptor protein
MWDKGDSHMHLRAFVDFVKAEESAGGANLPRIPPQRLGLGLHGGWGKLDASIDATFADSQDDIAENELPTEGYSLVDFSLGYRFADPGLYVFLRGTNLLDEDIRQHSSPLKDIVPLPGRSVHVGLRYEF